MTQMLNISDSVDAILKSHSMFGERFYATLFAGFPELEKHFEHVNMAEQSTVVTMALTIIEQYYSNPTPAARKYLQVLGSRHFQKGIDKLLYSDWLAALLDALSSFHEHAWNDAVERQWIEAVQIATNVMFEGYEAHFHV